MAKAATRGRPAKVNSQAEQLSTALAFVSAASMDDESDISKSYVRLSGLMAIATTGQISAGHPIAEDLDLCPHLGKLKAALARSGKTLVLAQTPKGQLSIKGDKLSVVVPCIGENELFYIAPDAPIAVVNDEIKEAFKVCGTVASEAGTRVVEASLLLEANTCTGTNGYALIQYWHGIDLPPHMVLPRLFTQAVAKVDKPLTGFGFTLSDTHGKPSSVTFWFEGGAWLRTQCYSDSWPAISHIVDVNNFPVEIPPDLFEAIEAVGKFSDDENPSVIFGDGKVMTNIEDDVGAKFEVKGLQAGKRLSCKLMKQISGIALAIDLTTYPDKIYFSGKMVRGAVMGMSNPVTEPISPFGQSTMDGEDDSLTDTDMPDDEGVSFTADNNPEQINPNVGWGQ